MHHDAEAVSSNSCFKQSCPVSCNPVKFRKHGILDAQGFQPLDPRGSDWRRALEKENVTGLKTLRLESDLSAVSEELNVMYARHEIVSDTTEAMLEFFDQSPSNSNV